MRLDNVRNRHFFVLDTLASLALPTLALTLRLETMDWWPRFGPALVLYTVVSLFVKLLVFSSTGLYSRYWRYASVDDLAQLLIATGLLIVALPTLFVGALPFLASYNLALPRTLPLLDGLFCGLAAGATRLALRGLDHSARRHKHAVPGRRVLVVGAGAAGTMVAREMRTKADLHLEPVAFVDDDMAKVGTRVQGLPVLGTCAQIPALVELYDIQQVIVAIPSASLPRQLEIVAVFEETGVAVYNLPGVYQLLAGYKTINRLPHVDVTRLLRRDPVQTDPTGVAAVLDGATVLITGAGGSIGSELCRQTAHYNPARLILLGHGESSLFEINLSLRLSFPDLVTEPIIADVRDQARIDGAVARYRPDVIFHAAAHKHVPLMEGCVGEALHNNVLGTRNVLRAAERHGVQRFVLISSDKAVHPSNVMGATKRLAEMLTMSVAQRTGRAFVAVRFGNVLGSRGSVIPVFQRQIAAGGPVTVTHPDMRRYFMTIPEAVQLVLGATSMATGGQVFVLDMGRPVRILHLAEDMIRLSGLKPGRDIEIVYSGIRPGEKLQEELFRGQESSQRTSCERIMVAGAGTVYDLESLEQLVLNMVELARDKQTEDLNERLRIWLLRICHEPEQYLPVVDSPLSELKVEVVPIMDSMATPLPLALTANSA